MLSWTPSPNALVARHVAMKEAQKADSSSILPSVAVQLVGAPAAAYPVTLTSVSASFTDEPMTGCSTGWLGWLARHQASSKSAGG